MQTLYTTSFGVFKLMNPHHVHLTSFTPDIRTAKVRNKVGMIAQNSKVYNPPTYLFSLYTYMEKDISRGVVYFTVLCDHPYLVSLLFAVLVSLPVFLLETPPPPPPKRNPAYILLHFQMFFITCTLMYDSSMPNMEGFGHSIRIYSLCIGV